MKLIRSFPEHVPANRNYVIDDAERIYNSGYDYSALAGIADDVLQLDWDTAVSKTGLVSFAQQARRDAERCLVAPVPIYPDDYPGLPEPYIWNCKVYEGKQRQTMRYVSENEPECDLFGFGMVYLPQQMIVDFIATGWHFDDITFASWYHSKYGPTRIAWDVRPVHLHYRISEVAL